MDAANGSPTVEEKNLEGIHYKVHGSGGQTVVLLRGLGRWSEHWLGFEAKLAAQGLRVISIDNRGFGKSSGVKIDTKTRMVEFADDVAHIIARESPAGAHVVGVSLGGMIALSLAAFKPQLVRSLTIVNSSIGAAKLSRISFRAFSAIGSVICGAKYGYDKLAKILLGPAAESVSIDKLARAWATIDEKSKPLFSNVIAQVFAAKRFNGLVELAAITCPVLVIKSEGDMFVDPKNSDFIHRQLRDSKMAIHPKAGHELAFDDPDWFADTIAQQVRLTGF